MNVAIPSAKHCSCGHRYRWYEPETEQEAERNCDSIFWQLAEEYGVGHFTTHTDIVERPCPHNNGTIIDYCPKCDAQVDMWGCGLAGAMECDCWGPPT